MNKILAFALAALATGAFAQGAGIQRITPTPAPGVAPLAAPNLSQPPAAAAPAAAPQQAYRPAPTPMPGAPMPDLVQESINMLAPMTPAQIRELRLELERRQKAAAEPMGFQGKPSTRLARLDLSPGATPEVIRISMSEGAVVSFIDAAGRPWPIENADSFNPTAFDIAAFGKNAISIASKVEQAVGNIAVRLEGMSGALTFKVLSGHAASRDLDYSVDLQLPRYLPGVPAPVGMVVTQPSLGADELMDYLLRTPPRDARSLQVQGIVGALAWQTADGRLMLRTEKLVLSPNAKRRQSSSDGMTVYELPLTPVALVSDDGRMVNVQISGFSISQESRK